MRPITFATTNAGKVAELADLLAPAWTVAQDARGYPEIQADTLREVTAFGAGALLASGLRPPFLLEDSGLFVDALQGFPGVHSRHALDTIGVAGLLRLLEGAADRGAAFATDLLLVDEAGRHHHFEGVCRGRIARVPAGQEGFGFDPVFLPDGQAGAPRAFAQMTRGEKGRLSHRGKAAQALAAFLIQTAKP